MYHTPFSTRYAWPFAGSESTLVHAHSGFAYTSDSGRDTLHIWKTIVKAGYGDRSFVHAAALRESKFSKPLVEYFLDISSSNCLWMTDLTLSDVDCSALELRQLAVLSSLQNLTIRYRQGRRAVCEPFDDSVLENMAYRAAHNGVFARLKVIFVENATCITAASFKSLNLFPELQTFCVHRTGVRSKKKREAQQYGWKVNPE